MWVAKRAADKPTWPGRWDQCVAGGLPMGEDPFLCAVRECEEEASIPEAIAREGLAAVSSVSLALVSVVACLVAPLASRVFRVPSSAMFRGSMGLASVFMTLFFVSIGAVAGGGSLGTAEALPLFGFIAVQLAVQLLVSLACGRALGIPLPVMLVACNANVGGAATAVAMCIQKRWTHLVNAALLVASLGYVVGNPISFAVLGILQAM